jgi:hypothetical protein
LLKPVTAVSGGISQSFAPEKVAIPVAMMW